MLIMSRIHTTGYSLLVTIKRCLKQTFRLLQGFDDRLPSRIFYGICQLACNFPIGNITFPTDSVV